tara:strand:- start:28377 stop:28553 length:177 start_codon:yes stop_codon:yes gene_type:complete
MEMIKEDIHSAEYQERIRSNLIKRYREFEESELLSDGNCLRASNPRVVVCHCAECGGK